MSYSNEFKIYSVVYYYENTTICESRHFLFEKEAKSYVEYLYSTLERCKEKLIVLLEEHHISFRDLIIDDTNLCNLVEYDFGDKYD